MKASTLADRDDEDAKANEQENDILAIGNTLLCHLAVECTNEWCKDNEI